MIRPTAPRPPPPSAMPPPPRPRRSSTGDGSSLAPGRNLIAASFLQIAECKRGKGRRAHERQVGGSPREQRGAGVGRAAERAEREDELGEPGRVDCQSVERILVERVERKHPPRDASDVLQPLRVNGVADLTEEAGGQP